MSGSLKSVLQKQYKAALARWPQERLRPDTQLQQVLRDGLADRLAGRPVAGAVVGPGGLGATPPARTDAAQLRQLNALLTLVDNRYQTAHRLTGGLLTPRSNPTYYSDLMTELDEAPKRSFLGRLRKRLGGMFRLTA